MTLWFRAKFFVVTPILCFILTFGLSGYYLAIAPNGHFTEPLFILSFVLVHFLTVGILYRKELVSKDTLFLDIMEQESAESAYTARLISLGVFYSLSTLLILLAITTVVVTY